MASLPFPKLKVTREDLSLSLLTGFGLSLVLIWNLYPHLLASGQSYKDLIVGSLAWLDYDKDREWKALNFLFAGFILFSTAIAALFQYLRTKDVSEKWSGAVHRMFWASWLPAVFWFGTALMRPDMPVFPLNFSGVLIILTVVLSLMIARRDEDMSSDDVSDAGFSSFLLLLLAVFSVLSVIVFVAQFSTAFRTMLTYRIVRYSVTTGIVSAAAFIFWNISSARSLSHMRRRFHKSLLLLQVALPLILFAAVSQYYVYQGSIMRMYKSNVLIVAVTALVFFSWYRLYHRYRVSVVDNSASGAISYIDMLTPACLYPAALYIDRVYFSWITYSFSTDDFHIGEQLLPWQQIVGFQKLPYFDFTPIHGLMALAYGGLNALFYGNTVATFPQAMLLLKAVFIALAFWSIFRFAGPWAALLLTSFLGITMNRMFLLIPVLLLFSEVFSGKHKVTTWLPLWALVCLFSVLYNVPVGAGLVLGSLPVVLYRSGIDFRQNTSWLRYFFLFLSACAFAIIIISPLRKMAFGFMHFILDNASTNTIANGVGMFQVDIRPKEVGFAATQFQWVFLKLSWIVVVVIAAVLFARSVVARDHRPEPKYVFLAALIPVTFFLIGKWLLERIAANSFIQRDGALSFLALTFFLPLLFAGFGSERGRPLRYLVSAFIIGVAIGVAGLRMDYKPLLSYPFNTAVVNNTDMLVSGKDIGLPRLGKLFADPKRIDELQSLRKTMDSYLKPGETFLDLTNHSALYYYLDMPVPVLYSADYVAANVTSLTRMIKQIKENPPPLVLIAPRIPWDGGPASLRSYAIYKELVTSYVPKKIGDHVFLIRPDRFDQSNADTPETQMDILDAVFQVNDLSSIPTAWGRSWNLLKDRFIEIKSLQPHSLHNFSENQDGSYKPTGENPHLLYEVERYGLPGKDIDYVLLDYSCVRSSGDPSPVLNFSWTADGKSLNKATAVRFSGAGSKAIVPVGAQPRWLFVRRLDSVRLELQDPRSCSALRVNRVSLLKQKT